MKEQAGLNNAQMIFNVKFSTASIVKSGEGRQPGGSIEAIAGGAAIIYI